MFVWEPLEMLIHSLPEAVGNSNQKFWLCWFTKALSFGVCKRRTPIRSGLFAFMSKFTKRKYSRSTNVVASHDGTLKWQSPHFRLTCAVQKRLCLSSLLGQLTTPENTITYHNTLCYSKILHKHCLQFLLGVKMDPIANETENNVYAKFGSDKQRLLWYVMVFSGLANGAFP